MTIFNGYYLVQVRVLLDQIITIKMCVHIFLKSRSPYFIALFEKKKTMFKHKQTWSR